MTHIEAVDLFCGAGGLSLGAARAGFSVKAGVELDSHAIVTHRRNFPNSRHLQLDVATLSGQQLLEESGVKEGRLTALIGGPPCQGFSSIGRRDPNDVRNGLFGHFMRLVAETKPLFFVAENVPGIAHESNAEVLRAALERVPQHYNVLPPLVVKADHYGAPTTRTRLFFIGIDTNRLPPLTLNDFVQAPDVGRVYVRDALAGLPHSVTAADHDGEVSWSAVGDLPKSRYFDRVQALVPPGIGDPDALDRYRTARQVSGHIGTRHVSAVEARFTSLKPGQRDPISRAPRLDWGGFCPTLRAGTGPEKGSFQAVRPVHPEMPRVITPREAARLQGFPDWFWLPPTKWHSFRQIGNSVSPLVAEAVLSVLYRHAQTHLASKNDA